MFPEEILIGFKLSDHVEKELGNYIHAFGEAHIVIMLMRCDKDTEWEITK